MSYAKPCWDIGDVLRVVTPDAEEISDHVFRAVHCPTDLQISDSWNGQRSAVEPQQIIDRFLEPGHRYVQAVFLGESGTGKSHLIQWLRLNLPSRPEDMVLTIPKAGTSLRGIVQRIVDRLPPEAKAPFDEKLKNAGTQTTTHQARVDKFLYSLAWSVEYAIPDLDSDERELAAMLPAVLSDPNFRRSFFAREGGSVSQIVRHIFDDPDDRDTSGLRRQFQKGDLPLGGEHYNDAAALARDAIDFIRGEVGLEQRAIDLMSRALESAIAQTLNFTADDLIDLMKSLRVHLAKQGRRLILLIEDFARLQGIDSALLQALVTPSRQENQELCELRWAMAVTTGYFQTRFDETVRSRANFVVDMDVSQPASIAQFAAGYLNAIRIGDASLLGVAPLDPLPNRCNNCERKGPCWQAFGSQDGIGLFPFNKTALNSFARRTGALEAGRFNPRRFLKTVIDPVLKQHYSELMSGSFPSGALLSRVGGENRLRPQAVAELERLDATLAPRRVALLELWEGSGSLVNPSEGLLEAFGLPPIDGVDLVELPPASSDAEVKPETVISSQVGSPLIIALHNWATRDAVLSQAHANDLRKLVYTALEEFIDWDALGIQKSLAAGPASLFKPLSINFARQQTARNKTVISLDLPMPGQSLAQTAVALEALVEFNESGALEREGGVDSLVAALHLIDQWAAEIAEQIKTVFTEVDEWSPITAAVEFLSLALFQSGRAKVSDSIDTLARKIFESTSSPNAFDALTPGFRGLSKRLSEGYQPTRELLKAVCSGTKGGVVGNFIRMTPILKAMRGFSRSALQLRLVPPTEVATNHLRSVAEGYARIKADFHPLLATEMDAWRNWIVTIRNGIGENRKPSDFRALIEELLVDIENVGIDIGAQREALRLVLGGLPGTQALNQSFDHALALENATGVELLVRMSLANNQRVALDDLVRATTAAVDRIENKIQGEMEQINIDVGSGLAASKANIAAALNESINALVRIESVKEGI